MPGDKEERKNNEPVITLPENFKEYGIRINKDAISAYAKSLGMKEEELGELKLDFRTPNSAKLIPFILGSYQPLSKSTNIYMENLVKMRESFLLKKKGIYYAELEDEVENVVAHEVAHRVHMRGAGRWLLRLAESGIMLGTVAAVSVALTPIVRDSGEGWIRMLPMPEAMREDALRLYKKHGMTAAIIATSYFTFTTAWAIFSKISSEERYAYKTGKEHMDAVLSGQEPRLVSKVTKNQEKVY